MEQTLSKSPDLAINLYHGAGEACHFFLPRGDYAPQQLLAYGQRIDRVLKRRPKLDPHGELSKCITI